MKNRPMLSIIISTFNRKDLLNRTLSYIAATQNYTPYEIIIVDQSNTYDATSNKRELEAKLSNSGSIQYYIVDFNGLPKARNYGIAKARGEILLFLDDDIEPYPDLFIEHVKSYEISDYIGGIAGRVIEEPDLFTNTSRIGGYVSFTGRVFRNFNTQKSGFIASSPGGNMSFKKSVMDTVGAFDEQYIGTSELEEADYCYRVRKAGYSIFYNSKAALKHLVSASGGCRADFADRQYYKMHNLGVFFARHKSFLLFPFLVTVQIMVIVKRVFSCDIHEKMKVCRRLFLGLLEGYFTR